MNIDELRALATAATDLGIRRLRIEGVEIEFWAAKAEPIQPGAVRELAEGGMPQGERLLFYSVEGEPPRE